MFDESKGVIIVYDKDSEEYAEYLSGLIATKDDKDGEVVGVKDGTVHAILMSEKEYNDTKVEIRSDECVIFIGENKTTKPIIKNIDVKYDKFGMTYGWLGKRAVVYVHTTIRKKETYEKFLNYAACYEKEFEKITKISDKMMGVFNKEMSKTKDNAGKAGAVAVGVGVVAPRVVAGGVGLLHGLVGPLAIPLAGALTIDNMVSKAKIKKQQYNFLIFIMYLEGLKEFLED